MSREWRKLRITFYFACNVRCDWTLQNESDSLKSGAAARFYSTLTFRWKKFLLLPWIKFNQIQASMSLCWLWKFQLSGFRSFLCCHIGQRCWRGWGGRGMKPTVRIFGGDSHIFHSYGCVPQLTSILGTDRLCCLFFFFLSYIELWLKS